MNHPISQQLQALHQAVNSNDAAALQQLYKDDAVLVDKPFISEHRDIHGALHEFKSRYMPEHVVSHGDEVVIEAGDTALVISKLYLNSKQAVDKLGCDYKKAIYVFRKNEGGEWQCALDNFFGVDLIDYV